VQRKSAGPLVSIVVNNFNYARFLGQCISSALSQSYPGTEVVVVDDASTDGSRDVIRGFGERVNAVLQDRNRGQGAAFNAGAAATHGDVVVFLDADDYLHPYAVEAIAAAWKPGLSKLQYRLDLVDAEGRRRGLMPAVEVRFDDGDVVPRLLHQGRYQTTVTSGNAFARSALDKVLPVPEGSFRISADGYLVAMVPFHGPVASLERVLGAYRLHGGNAWAHGGAEDRASVGEHLRVSLAHDEARHAVIRTKAGEVGLAMAPSPGMNDHDHLSTRLGSVVLDPARHPYASDHRLTLAARGMASTWAASGSPLWKAFLASWFLMAGMLPRALAGPVVEWRLVPSRRPEGIARLLRQVRRILLPERRRAADE
jgi:hypothetical protein